MTKKRQIILAAALVIVSVLLYAIHYGLFHDSHHIFLFLVSDIAFVPIEVLFVTLIIHRLLASREKKRLLNKMNMIIGVFFNTVGNTMLKQLKKFDSNRSGLESLLHSLESWREPGFKTAKTAAVRHNAEIDLQKGDIRGLSVFLESQGGFLSGLLANQNLLEHESFTNLLWAVFHLYEELSARNLSKALPGSDKSHLENDIQRVYTALLVQWLDYLSHLQREYPFLFSFAVRSNPFDDHASIVIGTPPGETV